MAEKDPLMGKDPFMLMVQKKLCAEIRKIQPCNGYHFDLSGEEGTPENKVFRGRATFGDDDPPLMVSILEDYQQGKNLLSKNNHSPVVHKEYRLLVQGFVPDDMQNPTDPAHYLQADLEQLFGILRQSCEKTGFLLDIRGDSGSVTNIGQDSGGVRPPDDLSVSAYCWLEVWLEVYKQTNKPYEH